MVTRRLSHTVIYVPAHTITQPVANWRLTIKEFRESVLAGGWTRSSPELPFNPYNSVNYLGSIFYSSPSPSTRNFLSLFPSLWKALSINANFICYNCKSESKRRSTKMIKWWSLLITSKVQFVKGTWNNCKAWGDDVNRVAKIRKTFTAFQAVIIHKLRHYSTCNLSIYFSVLSSVSYLSLPVYLTSLRSVKLHVSFTQAEGNVFKFT